MLPDEPQLPRSGLPLELQRLSLLDLTVNRFFVQYCFLGGQGVEEATQIIRRDGGGPD